MKWTPKQIKVLVDVAKSWAILAVPGGVVDAVIDGSRRGLDYVAVGFGFSLLGVALYLTGMRDGDKLQLP